MDEMPLQYLFDLLRRRFLLLFIASTLVAALMGVYAYGFRADEYTAEAVLYVLESYWDSYNNMRYDTNASTQFTADYKALIGKDVLMDRYARALDVPDLNNVKIDIEAENGTRVLKLSVTGKDPAFCARVANTVGKMFVDYIRELTQMDGLSLALEARTPGTPSGPPRKLYVALAFVGAFFLGICALLVGELVDTKLQSDEDIQQSLGLPVLGRVGGYAKELSAFLAALDTEKVSFLNSVSEATRESIKTLAMNTQFASLGKPMQTLVVTSTIPNEGKSTIAALLAMAIAGGRKRVLLIDMDFRNPTVGKLMKMHNQVDLIDYIYNQKTLEEVAVKSASGVYFIDNVHIVANASNMISTAGFQRFLDEAKARFDLIIFDAPPLGLLVDAAVLATQVDYTLFVIGSGLPDKAEVKLVAEQLRLASANVLGVVLNFVKDSKRNRAYYYRHKGYYGKQHRGRKSPR